MEHLAPLYFFGIPMLIGLRLLTGVIVGLIMARRPRRGRTRLGHVMAGITGAAVIPVAVESMVGIPVSLVSQVFKGWSHVWPLLGYIIGFSAAGAIVAVWLYRNLRLDTGESENPPPPAA